MALRDLDSILRALIPYFQSRPDVQFGYLFGSVVSGRARPDSDIDIAVLVSDKMIRGDPLKLRIRLMTDLMKLLNRDDVDLVLLNQAPPLLAHRILSKGRLIFERSASSRVAFQVRTVNRYLDTQPMRNLYLAYLKKHAREGRILGR
jgi:predicted nucleotidyltransferase